MFVMHISKATAWVEANVTKQKQKQIKLHILHVNRDNRMPSSLAAFAPMVKSFPPTLFLQFPAQIKRLCP